MNPQELIEFKKNITAKSQHIPNMTAIAIAGGIHCPVCSCHFDHKRVYHKHFKSQHPERPVTYCCRICHREYNSYPGLRNHCYTQHTDKYKCDKCPKTFRRISLLKFHQQAIHHTEYKCTYKGPPPCKLIFSTKKELGVHLATHKNSCTPLPCKTCLATIESIDTCENHIALHARFTYQCPICTDLFNEKKEAHQHLAVHFDNEYPSIKDRIQFEDDEMQFDECSIELVGGIYCHICDTVHKNRTEYDLHFTTSHEDEDLEYSCNICKKIFPGYTLLGYHVYDHTRKNKFACDRCDKVFSRCALLAAHSAVCGASEDVAKPFPCHLCSARFADDRRLRAHQRAEHLVNVIYCQEPGCGMTFDKPKDFVHHQIFHKKINNWCRTCALEFPTLSSCYRHLEVHKKREYNCPICTKVYSEKDWAVKHARTHFESTLHLCNVCGKVYDARRRLVEHLKSHSNDKTLKLQCPHCDKTFTHKPKYTQHLNVHTGERPYKCVACPKKFSNYPNWSKHLKNVHKIQAKHAKDYVDQNQESAVDHPPEGPPIDPSNYQFVEPHDDDYSMDPGTPYGEYSDVLGEGLDSDESLDLDPSIVEAVSKVIEEEMFRVEVAGYDRPISDMLLNSFLPENPTYQTSTPLPVQANETPVIIPPEYGPEFDILNLETGERSQNIQMDNMIVSHIDPILTLKQESTRTQNYKGFGERLLSN